MTFAGEIGPGHHSSKRGRTRSGKRARRKGVMTVTVKWTRPALIQNQIMTPIPQTHGDENTNTRSTGRLLKRSHGIITVTLIPVTESEQQTVVVCPLLKVAIAYLQFHWPSGCRDPSTESPAVGDLLLDKENVLSEVTLCEDPHRQTWNLVFMVTLRNSVLWRGRTLFNLKR